MNDARHTDGASPEPVGPFFVYEAEREAALGDVMRGWRDNKAEALAYAESIHMRGHRRTYVLSAAGSHIKTFRTDETVKERP
jgi:hypothetical protein